MQTLPMTPESDIDSLLAADLAEAMRVFDAEMRSDLPTTNALLERMSAYRGKLLRPRLLFLAGRATGEIRRTHSILAAVVEMIHVATLVHDDVLDEADLRRRIPTANRALGNEGAVLLGDYLISHSYHLCSGLETVRYARRLTAATNTVCEGELLQIARRGDFELTEADYLEIIERKTAALTSVCCALGAEAAEAPAAVVESLAAYGRDLGLAFQIVDDLLDLTATSTEAGKSVGRDAEMGELTLPLIRFRDCAGPAERERLRAALSNGHVERTDQVRIVLQGSDAVDYAMSRASAYARSAAGHLSHLRESAARQALLAATEYVVKRRQ